MPADRTTGKNESGFLWDNVFVGPEHRALNYGQARMIFSPNRSHFGGSCAIAFSSEVDTGSREENASKQRLELRF
jgi:hypothetical protein